MVALSEKPLARIALVGLTLFGCVGCDQASKELIRHYIPFGASYSYFDDTFRLTHVENAGAFLSLGAGLPEQTRLALFTGVVGLLSVGALCAALLLRGLAKWQVLAVALIAAGGCGNSIDRLTQAGLVTDFLNVGVGPVRTGIFNVADMVLMAGFVLLVLMQRKSVQSS